MLALLLFAVAIQEFNVPSADSRPHDPAAAPDGAGETVLNGHDRGGPFLLRVREQQARSHRSRDAEDQRVRAAGRRTTTPSCGGARRDHLLLRFRTGLSGSFRPEIEKVSRRMA